MYYIGLDVHKKTISYCVKDAAGCVHREGKPMESNTFFVLGLFNEIGNFRPAGAHWRVQPLNPPPHAPHLYRVC
jgi:hypothetical protein